MLPVVVAAAFAVAFEAVATAGLLAVIPPVPSFFENVLHLGRLLLPAIHWLP